MKRKTVTVNLLGVTRKLILPVPDQKYPEWIDMAEFVAGRDDHGDKILMNCEHVMAWKKHVRKHGLV